MSIRAKVANPDVFYGVISRAIKNTASDPKLVDDILKNLGASVKQQLQDGKFAAAFKALSESIIEKSSQEAERVSLAILKQLEASAITASALMIESTGNKTEEVLLKIIDSALLQMDTVGVHLITAAIKQSEELGKELCSVIIEDLQELVEHSGQQLIQIVAAVAEHNKSVGKELLTKLFTLWQDNLATGVNDTLVPAIIMCIEVLAKTLGKEVLQVVDSCSVHLKSSYKEMVHETFNELKSFTSNEFVAAQERLIDKSLSHLYGITSYFCKNFDETTIGAINELGDAGENMVKNVLNSKSARTVHEEIAREAFKTAIELFLRKRKERFSSAKLDDHYQLLADNYRQLEAVLVKTIADCLTFNKYLPYDKPKQQYLSIFKGKIAKALELLISNEVNKFEIKDRGFTFELKEQPVDIVEGFFHKTHKGRIRWCILNYNPYALSAKPILDVIQTAIQVTYRTIEKKQRGNSIFEQDDEEKGVELASLYAVKQQEVKDLHSVIAKLKELITQQEVAILQLDQQLEASISTKSQTMLEKRSAAANQSSILMTGTLTQNNNVVLTSMAMLEFYRNNIKMATFSLSDITLAKAQLLAKGNTCVIWDHQRILYFRVIDEKLQEFEYYKVSSQVIKQVTLEDEHEVMFTLSDGKLRYIYYTSPDEKPIKSKEPLNHWSPQIFSQTAHLELIGTNNTQIFSHHKQNLNRS